jgi:hypothetical protein
MTTKEAHRRDLRRIADFMFTDDVDADLLKLGALVEGMIAALDGARGTLGVQEATYACGCTVQIRYRPAHRDDYRPTLSRDGNCPACRKAAAYSDLFDDLF